eukprot:TRINITY_DN4523_c0_g1_i1.p1 TRINITY_DN4523_c0_g1~~TRINITY_DN4523_c0_g1_i1.p1  ORF type:complete len:456 (-),score=123.05 TRINITY_DN4523_c0_g1_i1:206-1573(-)
MAPAYTWLSTGRRALRLVPESVVFSEQYFDDSGSGNLTTAAIPIYDDAGNLVAVAGVDVPIDELALRSPNVAQAVDLLSEQNTCQSTPLTSCEQQALRVAGGGGVCVQRLPPDAGRCVACPRARPVGVSDGDGSDDRIVWVPFLNPEDATTAAAAAAACGRLAPDGTGRLATVRTASEAAAVAGVLGEDPTWIGASRADPGAEYVWALGGGATAPVTYTDGWVGGVPPRSSDGIDGDCVTADRRGTAANWVATPCTDRRSYVCEVVVSSLPSPPPSELPAVCGGEVTLIDRGRGGDNGVDQPTTINPPLSSCPLVAGAPAPCPDVSERLRRPFCDLGTPGNDCADRCCPGCTCQLATVRDGEEPPTTWSAGAIAGTAVGGLAILALLGAATWYYVPQMIDCARRTRSVEAERGAASSRSTTEGRAGRVRTATRGVSIARSGGDGGAAGVFGRGVL